MSDKEDPRVREARKAARIVAARHDVTYQQALDHVARDAGAAHWSGFVADATLHVTPSAYRTVTLSVDGTPAEVDPVIPLQRMVEKADRVARSVRGLLDGAERLVMEAEELLRLGKSPSSAASHAELLTTQARQLAGPLDDLAKDVLSLYDGHPRPQDRTAEARVAGRQHADIHQRASILDERIRTIRSRTHDLPPSEGAVDYYHRMRFGRSEHGHPDVFAMAKEENSPDSMSAALILAQYADLMRNLPSRMDREHGHLLAQWGRWTGYAIHNMPEIASGAFDTLPRDKSRLAFECSCFVKDAHTSPVPAYWHPDHPEFDRWKNGGDAWKRLCDLIATKAGLAPAYGVPVEIVDISDGMQPFPKPPTAFMGMHGAASVSDYADRVRYWAEWLSRGRRIVVRRWEPEETTPIASADEPYGESVGRGRPETEKMTTIPGS